MNYMLKNFKVMKSKDENLLDVGKDGGEDVGLGGGEGNVFGVW